MIPASVTLKGIWAALIALAFAILIALLAVQTVRLEGFKIWPISVEGWKPKAERMERERDACHDASKQNAAAQQAQKDAYERKYKELADDADKQVEQAQSEAMAAADEYIRTHRVRPNQGGISPPAAAPDRDVAGVPETMPSGVVVAETDVRACTALYTYAVAARNWAITATSATPSAAPEGTP